MGECVFGAAKGLKNMLLITLGTGVGSGIIIDGKIYRGEYGAGAEAGHMGIIMGGEPCTCGRRGCFEAYSSATALVKMTKEAFEAHPESLMREMCGGDIERVGGKTAFAAMKKGDPTAAQVVDAYIGYLACGTANLINIFQPEVLTIGGGISGEGDYLVVPLREKLSHEIYSKDGTLKTDIRIALLGNDAGIIGAAALVASR